MRLCDIRRVCAAVIIGIAALVGATDAAAQRIATCLAYRLGRKRSSP